MKIFICQTKKCASYIKQSLLSCFTQPVILCGSRNPCLSRVCRWTCESLLWMSWSTPGHHIRLCARAFIPGCPPRSSTSICSHPGGRSHYFPLLHNPPIVSWQLQTSHPTCLQFLIQTISPIFLDASSDPSHQLITSSPLCYLDGCDWSNL